MKQKWNRNVDLPQAAAHPLVWLLVSALPAVILLFVNGSMFPLIESALDKKGKILLAVYFVLIALQFFYACITGAAALIRKKRIHLLFVVPSFLLVLAYLIVFIYHIDKICLPWQHSWVVNMQALLYFQFVFLLPVIFYALVRFAVFPLPLRFKHDVIASALSVFIFPLCWYLGFKIIVSVSVFRISALVSLIFVFISLAMTLLLFLILIRLLLFVTTRLGNPPLPLKISVACLVGLLLPIGGLVLNRYIPFPANLQRYSIYIWTVVNGLLLVAPECKNKGLNTLLYYLRVASYPFVLYFFVLFLPFLPLSIPALVFFGGGFLILTPTILFFLYTKRLLGEYRQRQSFRKKAASFGSFVSIPLIIAVLALGDRIIINHALDHAFTPSYADAKQFSAPPSLIRHALSHQFDLQNDREIPFISAFYNKIVYDNLVLSTSKRVFLEKLYQGEISEEKSLLPGDVFFEEANIFTRSRFPSEGPKRPFQMSTDVLISAMSHSLQTSKELHSVTIRLHIENRGERSVDEFRTLIKIPVHAALTAFSLKIDGVDVPGRIFEKKTALFVYDSIVSTKRDPAIVYHLSPDTLALRVFPVSDKEPRECTLTLTFPVHCGVDTTVEIGAKQLTIAHDDSIVPVKFAMGERSFTIIPPGICSPLETPIRRPCVYFVIDRSIHGPDNYLSLIRSASKRLPEGLQYRYFCANYNTYQLSNMQNNADATSEQSVRLPRKRGGFNAEAALRRIVNVSLDADQRGTYPLIVFVTSDESEPLFATPELSAYFEDLIPEGLQVYRVSDTKFESLDLAPGHYRPAAAVVPALTVEDSDDADTRAQARIQVLMPYNDNRAYRISQRAPLVLYKDPDTSLLKDAGVFSVAADGAYFEAMLAKEEHFNWLNTHRESYKKSLLKRSKELGYLTPLTAFIVVEDAIQWKALEEKEKQISKSHDALDHSDTPEPGSLLLLLFAVCVFIGETIRRQKKRKGHKR